MYIYIYYVKPPVVQEALRQRGVDGYQGVSCAKVYQNSDAEGQKAILDTFNKTGGKGIKWNEYLEETHDAVNASRTESIGKMSFGKEILRMNGFDPQDLCVAGLRGGACAGAGPLV